MDRLKYATDLTSVKSLAQGPLLAVLSQAFGAVQLVLLLLVFEPGRSTDAYLYLWNLGMLPTSLLIVSVLYPMLLSDTRVTVSGFCQIGAGARVGDI